VGKITKENNRKTTSYKSISSLIENETPDPLLGRGQSSGQFINLPTCPACALKSFSENSSFHTTL